MITRINESKTLTKHVSCECKCKFDGAKFNNIFGKYLTSIMDDSAIMCDDIIESYNDEINLNEKKETCKTGSFYILLAFLLITTILLIAVSIYCYLIESWQKKTKKKTFITIPWHK